MRHPNPTDKRLTWVAERYPDPVLYDTITAFAAASARHGLVDEMRFTRAGQRRVPMTPVYALQLARGAYPPHTRYDRHLPWVAATLNRQHKRAMKVHRKIVARMRRRSEVRLAASAKTRAALGVPGPTPPLEGDFALARIEQLEAAKDTDEVRAALDDVHPDVRKAKRALYAQVKAEVAPGEKGGYGNYRRKASKMEANLVVIVDWAEGEGVDLTTYREMEDVIEQAQAWAEAQAELLDCDAVGPGELVYCWPDGWTVQELLTTDELVCEGKILAHCARDYTIDDLVVGGGDSRFFSLRDPSGKRVVTMMFDTTHRNVPGHALRGFANRTPHVPELARLYEFRMSHPDLQPLWRDESATAPQWIKRSSQWQGRYARTFDNGDNWESLDLFSSGLFDSEEASRAHDWVTEAFGHSEYDSALEWLKSADHAEQREDQGLPPMTEDEMEGEASEEAERQLQEQLDGFDPEDLRVDYGYQINERTFNDQEAVQGDLAWVHYLATGEELGGWNEGDEMVDWMDEYRSMESPRTGFAFYGSVEPAIHRHREGSRRVAYPFPPDADYGVIMRLMVDASGSVPPHWRPERLHAPGSVNCVAAAKQRMLA